MDITMIALAAITLALACCILGLWAVLGNHDLRRPTNKPARNLDGLTPDAMRLIKRNNKRNNV